MTAAHADRAGTSAGARRIIGIGEVLWDLLPDGPRLGGAPFNATAHLHRLGHETRFVSAVGDDARGRAAVAEAARIGIDTTWIARSDSAPTGTVDVDLDPSGSPRFRIVSPAAYETIDLDVGDAAAMRAWRPEAIVFGTLAQRFATVLGSTRRLVDGGALPVRLYDVNLRDGCWDDALVLELLALATIVKVNADEAAVVGRLLDASPDPSRLGPALADRYGTDAVCVTRGADGAALWRANGLVEVAGLEVDVVDAVGAGDAFAAALLDGLVRGRDPHDTLVRANRLGAIVASRSGALPDGAVEGSDAASTLPG